MTTQEIFHDCMTGTPPKGQDTAQRKRGTSSMTGENVAEDNSVDPLQPKSQMAFESACASLKVGSESYDGDIDSEKNSAIYRPGDAEMIRYTKQAQLWSLLGKSHGPDAASRNYGGEQKGTSNLGICMQASRTLATC